MDDIEQIPLSRFGVNIDRLRKQNGDTVDDVCRIAGVKQRGSYYRWLRGGEINEAKLRRLAEHYGVDASSLRYATDDVDEAKLIDIIETLEEHLSQRKVQSTPARKARLIAYLYTQERTTGEPLHSSVTRLVQAAA